MIELAALAATIVGKFLVPFALHGAQGIADKIADEASDSVLEVTKKVWEKVKSVFVADPDRQATFATFEKHPKGAAKIIEEELVGILEANKPLAEELSKLVSSHEGVNAATVMQESGVSIIVQDSPVSGTIIGIQNQQPGDDPRTGQDQK